MMNDFALILPEETVHSLSEGRVQGKVGVCVVRGGEGSAYVSWPGSVEGLVGNLPVTPSTSGFRVALPDVADEKEALELLLDAIRREEGRVILGTPPGFVEAQPVQAHGLGMMFGEEGIDVRIAGGLAARLGWREGDCIRLATSSDGETAVLHCDQFGSPLVATAGSSGRLEAASYLTAPFRMRGLLTDWFSPAYWISGGRIFFDLSEVPAATVDEEEPTAVIPAPPEDAARMPIRFVDGFLLGGFAAAAVGALLMCSMYSG